MVNIGTNINYIDFMEIMAIKVTKENKEVKVVMVDFTVFQKYLCKIKNYLAKKLLKKMEKMVKMEHLVLEVQGECMEMIQYIIKKSRRVIFLEVLGVMAQKAIIYLGKPLKLEIDLLMEIVVMVSTVVELGIGIRNMILNQS